MADDGYTTILRTTDPAQGELVAEMLRREGIDARFHQVSSTLIGMPGNLFEMTVDVPTEREALARELLADLEYVGASQAARREDDEPAAGGDVDDEPVEGAREGANEPLRYRRPMLAAGFAFFLPGGGHLYARRPWTALVLAVGVVVCLTMAVVGSAGVVFVTALSVIVICDAFGGVRAARAELRGEHRSSAGQLARGVGMLCVAAAIGSAAPLASSAHARRRESRLAELELSCTTGSISIANRSTTLHVVDIWNLRLEAAWGQGSKQYKIGPFEAQRLTNPPGAQGAITPVLSTLSRDRAVSPGTPAPRLPSWN